jgi:hypothetical protein
LVADYKGDPVEFSDAQRIVIDAETFVSAMRAEFAAEYYALRPTETDFSGSSQNLWVEMDDSRGQSSGYPIPKGGFASTSEFEPTV